MWNGRLFVSIFINRVCSFSALLQPLSLTLVWIPSLFMQQTGHGTINRKLTFQHTMLSSNTLCCQATRYAVRQHGNKLCCQATRCAVRQHAVLSGNSLCCQATRWDSTLCCQALFVIFFVLQWLQKISSWFLIQVVRTLEMQLRFVSFFKKITAQVIS